jgi:PAS domain S-box-containing protein
MVPTMCEQDPAELELLGRFCSSSEGVSSAASDRLRRAVARLVLETTAEGIWLIDAKARTTFVNRRAADLLGYTEEEMLGLPVFAFLDPSRWPIAEENLKLRKHGVEDRQEIQLLRKDGTTVWVLGSANPVFDLEGNYAGALAVFGELTSQKETETRLRTEIETLKTQLLAAKEARHAPPSTDKHHPTYREPFRTAIVLGTLGALVTTVAITTVGALLGSAIGSEPPSPGDI